jgi:hypothetical protein
MSAATAVDGVVEVAVRGGAAGARPLRGTVVVDKVGTAEEDLIEICPGLLGFACGLDDEDSERSARGGRTLSTFAAGPGGSCSVRRRRGRGGERERRCGGDQVSGENDGAW